MGKISEFLNHRNGILVVGLVLVLWSGVLISIEACDNHEDAFCKVVPSELNFGTITTPPGPAESLTVSLPMTLKNTGDAILRGEINLSWDAALGAPELSLLPLGLNPAFQIAPGDSTTFLVAITTRPNTSGGEYQGLVKVGTECSTVPISAQVQVIE